MNSVAAPAGLWLARCGVAALALALVVACVATLARPAVEPQRVAAGAIGIADPPGRAILRAWDDARAAAWSTGDVDRLAELYIRGSVAGRRDVAMLRAWNRRGAQGVELTTQVHAVAAERIGARRVVLRVTDRLRDVRASGQVVTADRPTTRTIELVRRDGRWLVGTVLAVD
ncbi:MAG: hypothetical protein WB767_18440 [Nocardioides sp.]